MTLDVTAARAGWTLDEGDIGQGLGHEGWRRPAVVQVVGDELRWVLESPEQALSAGLLGMPNLLAAPPGQGRRGLLHRLLRLTSPASVAALAAAYGVLLPSAGPGLHDRAGSEALALWWGLRDDVRALMAWSAAGDTAALPGPFVLVDVATEMAPVPTVAPIDDGDRGVGVSVSDSGRPVQWVGVQPRADVPRAADLLGAPPGQLVQGDGATVVALYVDALLASSRPVLLYAVDRGVVTHLPGVAAALALQLAGALARTATDRALSPALATCSGCGEPYQASRRPRAGQMAWCPACRADGTANRVRQQRHRAGKR